MDRIFDFLNKRLLWILIFIVVFPFILGLVFLIYGQFAEGYMDFNGWLGFWGSYLGGVATLIAIMLTLNQSNKHFMISLKTSEDQLLKTIKESNKPLVVFEHEVSVKRSDVRQIYYEHQLQPPSCIIVFNDNKFERGSCLRRIDTVKKISFDNFEYGYMTMKLRNVGNGVAVNMKVQIQLAEEFPADSSQYRVNESAPNITVRDIVIPVGEDVKYLMYTEEISSDKIFRFKVNYENVYNDNFETEISCGILKDGIKTWIDFSRFN